MYWMNRGAVVRRCCHAAFDDDATTVSYVVSRGSRTLESRGAKLRGARPAETVGGGRRTLGSRGAMSAKCARRSGGSCHHNPIRCERLTILWWVLKDEGRKP